MPQDLPNYLGYQPPANDDPGVDEARRYLRDRASASVLVSGGDATAAAKANAMSRATGLPADTVERNYGEVRQQQVARSVSGADGYTQSWFADPRNAKAGQHDVGFLASISNGISNAIGAVDRFIVGDSGKGTQGPLGDLAASGIAAMAGDQQARKVLPGVVRKAPAALVAGVATMGAGALSYVRGVEDFAEKLDPTANLQRRLFGGTIEGGVSSLAKSGADAAQGFSDRVMPKTDDWLKDQLLGGVSNLPSTIAALGLGLTGRALGLGVKASSAIGALTGGVSQGGQSYAKAREQGVGVGKAFAYANVDLATETAGEYVGELQFLRGTHEGGSVAKRLLRSQLGEQVGEQFSTIAQDVSAFVALPQNQHKTLGDLAAQLPGDMASTAVQTLVAGGLSNLTIAGVERAANLAGHKAREARRVADLATADAAFVDRLMSDSGAVKFREHDPEGFRQFVAGKTEGSSVEHMFVPAEKVATYFQSMGMDYHRDAFWGGYADQIDEGLHTGGDVVLPTADAAAHLTGTPAWEALRPDVRTSQGGMSPAEAERAKADHSEDIASLGSRVADNMEAEQQADEPRRRVYQDIRDKLTGAGFTQDAAHTNAELTAARYATRADRLGRSLVGDETQHIAVNAVLPPNLAAIVAADPSKVALKSVANVMRGAPVSKPGPSLLQWIASRGGIEDRGGDLESMGLAPIKGFARKGERKLIRPHVADGQGSMLGAGEQKHGHGPDAVLEAAIEAGYFPQFNAQRDGTAEFGYRELPTVNDLYAAIERELRGSPVHIEGENDRSQHARDAAEELSQIVDRAGYDPATATDAEVERAVDAYRQAAAGDYQQRNVGSQSFNQWFGDSKVVADDGKPLVVYHGTDQDFGAFDKAKRGTATRDTDARQAFFFSNTPHVADNYADLNGPGLRGQNVLPLYLKMSNPLERDMGGKDYDPREFASLVNQAKNEGRDGVIFRNTRDGTLVGDKPSTTYAVFAPTQIKSINNNGAFDASDPRILYQALEDEPRGQISFADGRTVIDLFQSRNMSTFIHEMGHQWLEELRQDAERDDAPDGLKADWQAVQDWFKANGHPVAEGAIPVDAHELWARGIERFAMEGKSPSTGLRRVFDAFKSWMLNIYKVVDNLRSPITLEIHQVMQRLVATDQEIAAAREGESLSALFTDAAQAGMSEAEFAAYEKTAMDAKGEAHDALLYKTMAEIRRSRTKAWQEEEAGARGDVTARVNRRSEFKALHLLRTGKMLDDVEAEPMRAKLSKEWLLDTYGEGVLASLPKGVPVYSDRDTMHADDIAERVGFASGDVMVRTLIAAEEQTRQMKADGDRRSLRQAMIDDETAREMRDRHGDPLNDGSIEDEALAAVHNDRQGEVIAAELRSLGRRTGNQPTPYSMAKEWARGKIASSAVQEATSGASIQRYARAAAKAGKAAQAAMLARDISETYRQKQAQMLNNALIAEAGRVRDLVTAARDRLAGYAKRRTMKSMDQDYLEQIHALLEQVDFKERSQTSVDRKESFEEWARAREAEGHDVVVPPSFAAMLGTTHWSRLTTERLLGLDDTVKQIAHLGRFKQTLLDGAEARDFAAVQDEAVEAAGHMSGPPPKGMDDPGFFENMKAGVASVDAMMLKMETVFDWLDGSDSNGVFNRIAFRPIADAQHEQTAMMHEHLGRLKALFEAIPRADISRWQDRMELPFTDRETGKPAVMQRQKIIAMALNIGNEGNLQRLADGYGWNADRIQSHLNETLTADEWQFVQGVWDSIGTLWPRIEAMEKRVNGVAPDKVEARTFDTPHGPMRGGYYPAIYDSERDLRAEEQRGRDTDLLAGNYTRAGTVSSATKDRASKVSRPILLDLGVINRHMAEVIHDVTHREPVMQAWKFLTNERVARAVDQALGSSIRKQLRPWVKHVANSYASDRVGNEAFGKFMTRLRANVTAVGLGLRATTILVHSSGLTYGSEVIGERWMAHGIAAMATSPVETTRQVMAASPEVRQHLEHFDRDIGAMIDRLDASRPANKAVQHVRDAQKFMFYGIGWMVQKVSVPVWIGGYNKSLSEGMSDEDARYAADKAVRQTMGTAGAKDLAAIQRSTGNWGQVVKLMTMFYTQMGAQYQRQRTLGRDVMAKDDRRPRDVPKLAARAFWLVAMAPMWDAVIKMAIAGHGPEDDESWAAWVAKHTLANQLAPIPGVRDIFQPVWNKIAGHRAFNPSITPLQSVYDSIMKSAGDAGAVLHGHPTKRGTRDTLETIGYATGLVPGQVASATQFLVDVGHGDQHPDGAKEWMRGLSTGTAKPKH